MYRRTKYSNLVVDIRRKQLPDQRYRVIASAIHLDTDARIAEIAPYICPPVSSKRLAAAEAEAITAIENEFYRLFGLGALKKADLDRLLADLATKVNNGYRLKATWKAETTNQQTLKFFCRNTYPRILTFLLGENTFFSSDQVNLENKMVELCTQHSGGNHEYGLEAAQRRLVEAEIIISHLHFLDSRIPVLPLTTAYRNKRASRPEQIKMLPISVLRRFYRRLEELVESMPKLVFFALACIFGCRPAEAGGLKPDDIQFHGDYASISIVKQEVMGRIIERLKNQFSYRTTLVPFWGATLLHKCCTIIGSDYPGGKEEPMNSTPECAEFVKQLLLDSGATTEQIHLLYDSLSDDDFDGIEGKNLENLSELEKDREKKIGCYVLRRCFASIGRHIMGLSLMEIDQLLGHTSKNEGTKKRRSQLIDLANPESQRKLAQKMERFIFNPEISLNPAFSRIALRPNERYDLIEYPIYKLKNTTNDPLIIEINLDASEPGEKIELLLPSESRPSFSPSSFPKSFSGIDRVIIGDLTIFEEEKNERN